MEQEEKDLVLIDVCGRLPYDIKIKDEYGDCINVNIHNANIEHLIDRVVSGVDKMVLRPLSSMTEKEKDEFLHFFPFCRGDMYFDVKNACVEVFECPNKITLYPFWDNVRLIDWLNKNMFDFRGLIPKGLAKAAPEGMYFT